MRIKIIQKPTVTCIDGVPFERFVVGYQYEVGNLMGAVMLAEKWAEPVPSDEPVLLVPLDEVSADRDKHLPSSPPNLVRETYPPYYENPPAVAFDRRRRPRNGPT